MCRLPAALAAALFLVLASQPARAAVIERMTLADLVSAADVVVQGTVVSIRSRYDDAPRDSRIVTDVTVRVDEAARGTPGDTVVVTVPGGEVGDRGQVVPGAPRFRSGEEVVLFLRGATPGTRATHRVVGLSQGAFRVLRDGGAARAVQRFHGVTFTGPGAADALPEMRVRELLDTVRGAPAPAGGTDR